MTVPCENKNAVPFHREKGISSKQLQEISVKHHFCSSTSNVA